MPDHGEQLGVDINELYRTAHFLSLAQADFVQAVREVDAAAPPRDSGQWTAMVPAWGALRAAIAQMLGGNAETLNESSLVLTVIAQEYAETDQRAAASFASLARSDTSEQGW
jgi:phosphopantetheinyl transferase